MFDTRVNGHVNGRVSGNGSTPPERARHTMGPLSSAKAPLVLAPLAAAAGFLHAHDPDGLAKTASRMLNGTVFLIGGGLLVSDILDLRDGHPFRPGALVFAAAGIAGLLLDNVEWKSESRSEEIARAVRAVGRRIPRRRTRHRIVVRV